MKHFVGCDDFTSLNSWIILYYNTVEYSRNSIDICVCDQFVEMCMRVFLFGQGHNKSSSTDDHTQTQNIWKD